MRLSACPTMNVTPYTSTTTTNYYYTTTMTLRHSVCPTIPPVSPGCGHKQQQQQQQRAQLLVNQYSTCTCVGGATTITTTGSISGRSQGDGIDHSTHGTAASFGCCEACEGRRDAGKTQTTGRAGLRARTPLHSRERQGNQIAVRRLLQCTKKTTRRLEFYTTQ